MGGRKKSADEVTYSEVLTEVAGRSRRMKLQERSLPKIQKIQHIKNGLTYGWQTPQTSLQYACRSVRGLVARCSLGRMLIALDEGPLLPISVSVHRNQRKPFCEQLAPTTFCLLRIESKTRLLDISLGHVHNGVAMFAITMGQHIQC